MLTEMELELALDRNQSEAAALLSRRLCVPVKEALSIIYKTLGEYYRWEDNQPGACYPQPLRRT